MADPTPQKNDSPKKSDVRDKVSPFFQIVAICITAVILTTAIALRMDLFRAVDEPIVYKTMTPQKLREYGGSPEFINVGLHIERFQEFDVIKNKFQFVGSLWFDFEAGAVSIGTLQDFSFDRATILYRSEPDMSLHGTRLMVRYVVRVAFNAGLIYEYFPLDDHRVNLVLTHPFLSPEEVIFETKAMDFTAPVNLNPFGWSLRGKSVKSGYLESDLSEQDPPRTIQQPLVGFSLDIERYGGRYTLAILLPIILINFLMFFAFSVDAAPSISIALGGITGTLAYRYVIEQLSPLTGDMMLSDQLYFLFLSASMLIFLFNKIDLFLVPLTMTGKKLSIAFIHLLTITFAIYFLVI